VAAIAVTGMDVRPLAESAKPASPKVKTPPSAAVAPDLVLLVDHLLLRI
jgi:hypothetical protein